MNWTDERVEQLKRLWAEGYSASQIAAQMGGVTRNAVIGKAHRLKLAGRVKNQPRRPNDADAANAEAEAKANSPELEFGRSGGNDNSADAADCAPMSAGGSGFGGNGGGGRINPGAAVVGSAALNIDYEEDAIAEAGAEQRPETGKVLHMRRMRKLTLMQLTEHTCKWPVGDPLSEDFFFCGADSGEGGPYCACHAKIAFNTDKRR